MIGTERGHQRADRLKPQTQTTSQSDHRTTALSSSMKLSHAVWGLPKWMGHGGEVRQNVVHWRSEWQNTSVFLPWEPHEQYQKAKRKDTERWTPQVGRCPICYWRSMENNSRKNEGMEPKKKQDPVVDGTSDRSKVQCCKKQYCIGTWNVRSMNQGKL